MKPKNQKYDYYQHPIINNLKELVDLGYREYTNHIAYSFTVDNRKVQKTYADVYRDVSFFSAYFYHQYHHKHIALVGENSYNWIITFLAIVLSGNVCVVIDKDLNEKQMKELLKISDTNIIYYSNNYCPFISQMKYDRYPIDNITYYLEEGEDYHNDYQVVDDKEAALFFTSGTTGPTKAVVLTQKSIARNIYGASSLFKPFGSVVAFLPFHHAFGFITGILKAFYYDTEVYISNSLKYLVDDFKKEKPEIIFAVPAFVELFYKMINKRLKAKNLNIDLEKHVNFWVKHIIRKELGGKLDYIICGGAPLDTKYIRIFRNLGIEILNGYGITECSPVVSVNRNNYHKDGSVGVPCRGVEVAIIDGEICVKGDVVMKEYYRNKEANKQVFKDGYFHTGDLGYIDEDGFIFITGRKKNIIILSNGENISPEVIEQELIKQKGVEEIIIGEEDNRLTAYIYPEEDYLNNKEYFDNIIYEYNQDKPKNHQITNVILRDKEFIKNNSGKILRDKVKEG